MHTQEHGVAASSLWHPFHIFYFSTFPDTFYAYNSSIVVMVTQVYRNTPINII